MDMPDCVYVDLDAKPCDVTAPPHFVELMTPAGQWVSLIVPLCDEHERLLTKEGQRTVADEDPQAATSLVHMWQQQIGLPVVSKTEAQRFLTNTGLKNTLPDFGTQNSLSEYFERRNIDVPAFKGARLILDE